MNIPWSDCRAFSVEPTIATGDLIAMGGRKPIHRLVQRVCNGPVDHVAPVLRTITQGERPVIWLVEAVIPAVRVVPLRHRLEAFEGDVWWLPLGSDAARRCDFDLLITSLLDSIGRSYDEWAAIRVGFERPNRECATALFCSELAGFAYKDGGLVRPEINPSNTDPVEICKWGLWGTDYHYVKGNDPRELPGFNTIPVGR